MVRASFSRVHEQVNGRDAVTSFGSSAGVGYRDEYDVDFDGVFETVVATPPRAGEVANYEFDPTLHQPVTDEFVAGYRRQFAGELALDVAYVYRNISDGYATTDVNGIYPDGPFQPFGGYGLIDPNRGQLDQLTNNTWMDLRYHALEVVVAKRMSNNWQAMEASAGSGTLRRGRGTRRIAPDSFNRTRLRTRSASGCRAGSATTTATSSARIPPTAPPGGTTRFASAPPIRRRGTCS